MYLVALLPGQKLCSNNVVGLDPSGGTYRETGFRARGEFAGGLVVAAKIGCLRRGQVGLCIVTLAAVSHRQLGIPERRLGFACNRGPQNRNRFVGMGLVNRCNERLPEQHLYEWSVVR